MTWQFISESILFLAFHFQQIYTDYLISILSMSSRRCCLFIQKGWNWCCPTCMSCDCWRSGRSSLIKNIKISFQNILPRSERIIRYSNIIRILEPNTSIRIRIRVTFWNRILFVFVFRWFSQTEYYSYSYSGNFLKPNIICIRIWVICRTEYYLYL